MMTLFMLVVFFPFGAGAAALRGYGRSWCSALRLGAELVLRRCTITGGAGAARCG